MESEIKITQTIHDVQKFAVAQMYYQAFLKKFSTLWLFVKVERTAIPILRDSINYQDGLYAVLDGKVVGFVGLETDKRYYTQFNFSTFSNYMYSLSAAWRYIAYGIYRLFHGKPGEDILHIDPIVVSAETRGLGIGTKLIEATFEYAKKLHKRKVILEVVDTNPRAKKLYEKMGFRVAKVKNTSLLTNKAGFSKVYHMEKLM